MTNTCLPRIFLIVPHSYCGHQIGRDCDRVSAGVAFIIGKYNGNFIDRKASLYIQIADRLRLYGNYKRSVTYGSAWRQKLGEVIKSRLPNLIIEIHSFPPDDDNWSDVDLVIFKSVFNAHWIDEFARNIKLFAPKICIQIVTFKTMNSFTTEIARNTPHLLVEFNENGKKIEIAAHAVLDAAAKMIGNDRLTLAHNAPQAAIKMPCIYMWVMFLAQIGLLIIFVLYHIYSF